MGKNLKRFFRIIGFIFLFLLLFLFFFAVYRTWKTQTSSEQKVFLKGALPSPAPNGFYEGTVSFYSFSWKGKVFDSSRSSGINRFEEADKFPFKTYVGNGLADGESKVLKIDYNIKENPPWIRFFLDEIVQTSPGKYLGKIHMRLIHRLPFTLGYFRLERNQ